MPKRIPRLYIAFEAFFSLFLWLPIFYQFQKTIGLNDRQIFSIQSFYYLAFCFLEIPTGWVADHWGYRRSILWGTLIMVFSNLIPAVSQNFLGMLAHFILIATSRSLISGAASAYLFEACQRYGVPERYKIIEGEARAWGLVGKVICWPLVGLLMSWHLSLPYLITSFFSALSFLCVILLPNQNKTATVSSSEGNPSNRPFKVCLVLLSRSPMLLLLMIQGISIFVMGRLQVTFYQPILLERSMSVASLGGIMAVMTLFEALGSWTPSWLRRFRISDLNSLFIVSIALTFSWFLIAAPGKYLSIVGFCLFCFFIGIVFPIQKQVINEAIPDSRFRATILSIESVFDRLGSAGLVSIAGSYAARGQLNAVLTGFAWFTLVILGLIYLQVCRTHFKIAPCQKDSQVIVA
ncbi:MAG: MFS transporter [Deltaproteobacteria bacterium]|nr:MFS transporter [Deltaproteobacteria bacterium]